MNSQHVVRAVLLAGVAAGALIAQVAYARHGDETVLPNRIPEAAPYVVNKTVVDVNDRTKDTYTGEAGINPPLEWNETLNAITKCDGCHTVISKHWSGSMMSNAWRDPGWRGAFLLVARSTSTDGCADTPLASTGLAADGSKAYDCSDSTKTLQDGSGRKKPNSLNPFASVGITSTTSFFNTGNPAAPVPTSGSGSLMDDFCSRCHMPTDYIDATSKVYTDLASGMEHGDISPSFDPTEKGTQILRDPTLTYTGVTAYEAFGNRTISAMDGRTATVNSLEGKQGIGCVFCHTNVASKDTPYNNFVKGANSEYTQVSALGTTSDINTFPDTGTNLPSTANLGYSIGAGAFRVTPDGVNNQHRYGPLWGNVNTASHDYYLEQVFDYNKICYNKAGTVASDCVEGGTFVEGSTTSTDPNSGNHSKNFNVKFERSEFCGSCHDVTNPVTVKNEYGYWAGGFAIERTYSEWLNSRYAKRAGSPTNTYGTASNAVNSDGSIGGKWERDCQSCHMQQTFGNAGTALTLFNQSTVNPVTGLSQTIGVANQQAFTVPGVTPVQYRPYLTGPSHDRYNRQPHWTHHFVGGNAYMTKMIGGVTDGNGTFQAYPELLNTSFSSREPKSLLNYARFTTTGTDGAGTSTAARQTQHERFAWDRLRNAVGMKLNVQVGTKSFASTAAISASATVGSTPQSLPLDITVSNDGSGHNFPTGFPEGRAAWVRITAWDTQGGTVKSPYDTISGTTQGVELQIETTMNTLVAPANIAAPAPTTKTTTSFGVGYLTNGYMRDPNYLAECEAKDVALPLGSIDPYAWQFKAVASLDKKCPTLDLPYATAINLKTETAAGANFGLPLGTAPGSTALVVITKANAHTVKPAYEDYDKDGDLYDDSYLMDSRLRAMPHTATSLAGSGAVANIKSGGNTRKSYKLLLPEFLPKSDGTASTHRVIGPIALTVAVYYQSFESVVARKFLGNLANIDDDTYTNTAGEGTLEYYTQGPILEPCVLKGSCDRIGKAAPHGDLQLRNAMLFDPVVVEGAPPVPVELLNAQINITRVTPTNIAPTLILNNSKATGQTNMQAVIPNNRHWSPSPYGGVKDGNSTTVTWNYGTASGRDGIGEVDVESRRIIKVSFSEPVKQCVGTATCGPLTSSSLYLTDTSGAIVKALVDQIDDTTWALFPYESEDNGSTLGDGFLSRKTYVAHVVPANIKDFDGMLMANNSSSAANGASEVTKKNEYTWAFTVK